MVSHRGLQGRGGHRRAEGVMEHRAEKRLESLKEGAKGKEGLRNRHEATLSQLLKVQKG